MKTTKFTQEDLIDNKDGSYSLNLLKVEDFGIETIPGKESIIQINLTQGGFVKVGEIELGEFSEDLGMYMRDPHYYHSSMRELCERYLSEVEYYKIEKED